MPIHPTLQPQPQPRARGRIASDLGGFDDGFGPPPLPTGSAANAADASVPNSLHNSLRNPAPNSTAPSPPPQVDPLLAHAPAHALAPGRPTLTDESAQSSPDPSDADDESAGDPRAVWDWYLVRV